MDLMGFASLCPSFVKTPLAQSRGTLNPWLQNACIRRIIAG